jgi:type IV secretory pathway ATPase VirB11/archaellum biosynthesis ATPase
MDLEQHNHRQIEQLNQRGGRMLSIVDLIQAGTIRVQMAAYAMRAMAEGASLLTAAGPGGAGKTTLMAALLNFLPPLLAIAARRYNRARGDWA